MGYKAFLILFYFIRPSQNTFKTVILNSAVGYLHTPLQEWFNFTVPTQFKLLTKVKESLPS